MSAATAPNGVTGPFAPRRVASPSDHPDRVGDLERINQVVAAAVGAWNLPARVRRLALPSLLYNHTDLEHMSVVLVEGPADPIAVAIWEVAAGREALPRYRAVLLHGLYVVPHWQGRGLGTNLLELASHRALTRGFDAVTVKAWRESEAFFRGQGFAELGTSSATDSYPRRMWKALR